MVQWLGVHPSTAGRVGSVLHGGTKIPHAMGGWVGQKNRVQKKKCEEAYHLIYIFKSYSFYQKNPVFLSGETSVMQVLFWGPHVYDESSNQHLAGFDLVCPSAAFVLLMSEQRIGGLNT